MFQVFVDDRVPARHLDVSKQDAIDAWYDCVKSAPRLGKDPGEYLAIGFDRKGRQIELVAVRNADGDFLIYHAMTPPSANARRELGLGRRKRE